MTTVSLLQSVPDIVIRSEEDAYEILRLARDGEAPEYGNLIFDGWPTLNLHFQGDKFHQSITPTVMRGLLDFQKGIYQSYATAKYDNSSRRLSDDEKSALEIRVDVKSGSSGFEVNFQELAIKLIEQLGSRMDPEQVLITVVAIAVLYFGTSSYRSYLENRKETRSREIGDETQRKTLEALQFTSAQETERMKVVADLARKDPRIESIGRLAYDAHTGIVKSMSAGTSSSVEGIELTPEIAESLTRNTRRKSTNIRLDGIYRLIKLDWSDPLKFKVRVFNTETGLQLDAEVQDESLTGKYKEALREAEWSRMPVALKINAVVFGENDYREAIVISADTFSGSNDTA